MRGWLAATCVLLALVLGPALALAHDLRPGAVALREVEPGRYALRLTPPQDGSQAPFRLAPELPSGCDYASDGVRCEGPLEGELRIPALADRRVKVVVHVTWLDGRTWQGVIREGESAIDIEPPDSGAVVGMSAYLRMGIEHMLGGVDHLLFVLGLALVAVDPRRVAVAVTGFTVAHSITLGVSALGAVVAPPAATELVIAASIVVLAAEAARDEPSWTARWPWAVAFLFGLVHGFGFAGALAEIGLPADAVWPALLLFNLGVELGQLAFVGALVLLGTLALRVSPTAGPRAARVVWALVTYAIGGLAVYWLIDRAGAALW